MLVIKKTTERFLAGGPDDKCSGDSGCLGFSTRETYN